MTDLLLDRLTMPAPQEAVAELGEIPWPEGLKPATEPLSEKVVDAALPEADIVVMAYTASEKQATADVLSPGVQSTSWARYTHNWDRFESQLTGRSPARESKCLATVCPVKIGSKRVLLVGSELHLSTDGKSMPVCQLVQQIAHETQCSVFIDTGTAGGVGATEVLGDVVLGAGIKFNLAGSQWEHEPYAQERWPAPTVEINAGLMTEAFGKMIPAAIGDSLKPSGYADRPPQLITGKDIETVAIFAFADTADSYGVVKNDPNAGVEEMDAGATALALSRMAAAPLLVGLRNASDPQMGGGSLAEQKSEAARIYARYGYTTTVCSSLAVWAVIASQ